MLISTSDKNITSSLQDALFFCQPDKDSLWTFDKIPSLSEDTISSFKNMNFIEISTIILDILINQDKILIPIKSVIINDKTGFKSYLNVNKDITISWARIRLNEVYETMIVQTGLNNIEKQRNFITEGIL